MRLVFPNKSNYESLILANNKNLFNETDNSIKVMTVNSGPDAAEAFATGNADVIATGTSPAVILLAENMDAVIVARYLTGEKMHHLIADTSIHSMEDLKGKRLGVQEGSTTHVALLAWLKNNNIPVGDINIVPMQPANMPEAMKNRQLDAIAGSQPWPINVKKLCSDRVYELSDLYNPANNNAHALIAKRDFYNTNKKVIEELLDAIESANQMINSNPVESAGIIAKSTGFTPEQQLECIAEIKWSIGFDQNDIQSLEETAKTLYELNYIKRIPDITGSIAGKIKER